MPLEKELAANTEAVTELTAVMKEVLATQKAALAKLAPSKSDDADEDEAPKKTRRSRDEDEDEAPKSRRRSRDADEDEDEAPKSKRRSRDADEDEDEDEKPKSRRRSRDEDEDEDEAPKSKRRSRDADEDEDEDEKPKSKKTDKPTKKSSKDKGPSLAAVRAAIADLMDCDKGDEEDRNDFIEAMYDHLDVANATEIDEKDFERVLEWIAKKKSGKKVKFD